MQCPKCQSNDIQRSRRRLLDHALLPLVRAQVYRCRDCKKRFWAGVQWGPVILGSLTFAVVAVVAVVMVAAHHSQGQKSPAPEPTPVLRSRPVRPMPRGLPPLSSVPAPKDTGTVKR
jgi:hypothetical protein